MKKYFEKYDLFLFFAFSILILFVFYNTYILSAINSLFFYDEIYNLRRWNWSLLKFIENHYFRTEVHPITYGYLISRLALISTDFPSFIRLSSLIPNFLFFSVFLLTLIKLKKGYALSGLLTFFLMVNFSIQWWSPLARSLSWINFLFIVAYYLRSFKIPLQQYKFLYSLVIITLGWLHYTTLILVLCIIFFENKKYFNYKWKLISLSLISPNLFLLARLMINQDLQPDRVVNHYLAMNPIVLIGIYFQSFDYFFDKFFLLFFLLFVAMWIYLKENLKLKDIYETQRWIITASVLFFTIGGLSWLFDKRWLIHHTFFFIHPVSLLVFFHIVKYLNKNYFLIFLTLFLLVKHRDFLFTAEGINDNKRYSVTSSFIYISKKSKLYYKSYQIYGCIWSKARESVEFLTKFNKLRVNLDNFNEVCDNKELLKLVTSAKLKGRGVLILKGMGYSKELLGAIGTLGMKERPYGILELQKRD